MYQAAEDRYEKMDYKRCGRSGVKLPRVSLGLWQNFGLEKPIEDQEAILCRAFDLGVTHFDLANNYGFPAPGKAEENFGEILRHGLGTYRDEMIISTKAGYDMWPGPYGNWGSRKYLMASLDQSLKRMGLEYVDIFYHHCMTPDTPLKETALCLADLVRRGKTLYVGMSNYDGKTMHRMYHKCDDVQAPFVINQNRYSIFDRTVEKNKLLKEARDKGKGVICFSPLAQGQLSDKYAKGIPEGARLFGNEKLQAHVGYDQHRAQQIEKLYQLAKDRGETLSQLAIQWLWQQKGVTSVLVGVHSKAQLLENLAALEQPPLSEADLIRIDSYSK